MKKKKKARMETGLNVNFCVRKEWNKNVNSYLPCLHNIALGEFTRNQYKNLPIATKSRGWTGRELAQNKTYVSPETVLGFDHRSVLTNPNIKFNLLHFIHQGQAISTLEFLSLPWSPRNT